MLYAKEIFRNDMEACVELDSNTICLWTKKQWEGEFKKKGAKFFALFLFKKIIGVCVIQLVVDEAQLNYFTIKKKYRRKGYGRYLMDFLISQCEKFNLRKITLEVSDINIVALKFYDTVDFLTVGKRSNYYRNGSNAVLKEKILKNK